LRATENESLAKLIADAANALEHNQASALTLLRRAATLLQSGDHVKRSTKPPTATGASLAPWQVERVADHIRNHLHRPIALRELAAVLRLSNSQFCRSFKGAFGQTPHAYIISQRIELAMDRMLNSHAPLSQIAVSYGFTDRTHFTRQFRRNTGFTPSQWRRANRFSPP